MTKKTGRLYVEGAYVFYKERVLCHCFDTDLCDKLEVAETIAALFNSWLDKQEAIDEALAGPIQKGSGRNEN